MSNKTYFVEVLQMALFDLDEIYEYYFTESMEREVAEMVTTKIKNAILGLSVMPKSHPLAKESRLKKDGLRKLICGEFVIPFLINEKTMTVSIVRVFHGKMNYLKYL